VRAMHDVCCFYLQFSIDIPPLSLPWENLTQDILSTPHKCSSPDGTHTFAGMNTFSVNLHIHSFVTTKLANLCLYL